MTTREVGGRGRGDVGREGFCGDGRHIVVVIVEVELRILRIFQLLALD